MTKKDYVRFAKMLVNIKDEIKPKVFNYLVDELSAILSDDNSMFDKGLFWGYLKRRIDE